MWTVIDSPLGRLRPAAEDGALVALDFLDPAPEPGLFAATESRSTRGFALRAATEPPGGRHDDDPFLAEVAEQLTAYFSGDLKDFHLPLAPRGTPFQQQVWEQLTTIGYGDTATYGEIARRLGRTGHGARAVGVANGRNPIPVVIPCHRVVGSSGALTGYGGGIARKELLLSLEGGLLRPASQ